MVNKELRASTLAIQAMMNELVNRGFRAIDSTSSGSIFVLNKANKVIAACFHLDNKTENPSFKVELKKIDGETGEFIFQKVHILDMETKLSESIRNLRMSAFSEIDQMLS